MNLDHLSKKNETSGNVLRGRREITSREMRDENQMTEKQPTKESAMTAPTIGKRVMLPFTKL